MGRLGMGTTGRRARPVRRDEPMRLRAVSLRALQACTLRFRPKCEHRPLRLIPLGARLSGVHHEGHHSKPSTLLHGVSRSNRKPESFSHRPRSGISFCLERKPRVRRQTNPDYLSENCDNPVKPFSLRRPFACPQGMTQHVLMLHDMPCQGKGESR